MATAGNNNDRLTKSIESLELEELAIERKILNGELSKEEGLVKKRELGIQLQDLKKQIESSATQESTAEHTEETHTASDHSSNHAPHPHTNDHEEKKAEATSDAPKVAAPVTISSLRPTMPNPNVAYKPEGYSKTPKKSFFSRFKGNANKTISAGSKVYSYTPVGFLSGVISDRLKEWEFAKATTEKVSNFSLKKYTSPEKYVKGVGAVYSKTPLGILWNNFIPESAKKAADDSAKWLANKVNKTALTKQNGKESVKKTSSTTLNMYKKLYSKTPLGILWNNFIPESAKKAAESAARSAREKIQTKTNDGARKAPQKSLNLYGKLYSKTPLGQLYKRLPQKRKDQLKKPLRAVKSAKEYQKILNKKMLAKAAQKGYNRFGLLQKIKNSKVFKSKAWKYGKYAISPLAAGLQDRREYLKSRTKKHDGGSVTTHTKLSKLLQGQNPYSEWTSPKSLSSKAWRKYGQPKVSSLNRKIGQRFGNGAAKKAASRASNKIATTIGKQAIMVVAKIPVVWLVVFIVVGIIALVVTFIILITGAGDGGSDSGGGAPPPGESVPSAFPIPGFTLSLEGPTQVDNCQDPSVSACSIEYTITYTYTPSSVPIESITIYSDIPTHTVFESATGDYHQGETAITWPLNRTNNSSPLKIQFKPQSNDVLIPNKVYARTSYSGGAESLKELLPTQITPSEQSDAAQQQVVNQISAAPDLVTSYQAVERATGVPWQVLAGIHYREGSLDPNMSLASGRQIGEREPDIERGGGCSSTYTEGEPVALPGGGCGFRTFTDSAIFAANHLKGKNGGNVPASFQELAKSLAYYNGYPGNSNCYHGAPYPNCPAQFPGDDNPYVTNLFDKPHEIMYIIFCDDGVKCNPPTLDPRPGVASVIMGLSRFYNTTQL